LLRCYASTEQISYWCGATHSKAKSQGGASVEGQANRKLAYDMAPDDWSEDTNEFFEEEPKDLRKVVEIEDLKKVTELLAEWFLGGTLLYFRL